MSGKDNTGWKRGAGPYSRDYCKFEGYKPFGSGFPSRDISAKIEGVGDYDGEFTGQVSRSNNHPTQGRYSKRGEGAYSKSRGQGSGKQGNASGGQKVSD